MPKAKAPYLRFMESYQECPISGCWIWIGDFQTSGYGRLKVFGSDVSAHRFSYELHKGPITDGMHILHTCDVKACVNPEHLREGTHQENMREAAERKLFPVGSLHHFYGKPNPRPNQSNIVKVLGRIYQSQKQAERELGLGNGTVRYWIKNYPEKAQIIKKGSANA